MIARLRFRGEEQDVQLVALEDDVRAGRVPGLAEVRHGPWTGTDWVRVDQLPQLAEALDGAGARLSDHLRTGPWPWASSLVTLFILGCGVLQGFAVLFAPMLGDAGAVLKDLFLGGLTGLDALVFEGRWATSFTSQLTHGGARHLFPNLAVIGYAGFRVERALGAGGYLAVAASSVVVGTLGIAVLESVPVMGSSVLGYGLWASMLAVGLRFDDHLPPADRRFYGFGAIALFLVLVAGTLGQEGVSHTGHAFGFLGGVLATFGLRPETVVPRARRRTQAWRNAAIALALCWLPVIAANTLYRVPTLLLGAAVPVQVDGWTLAVPQEMADRTASIGGARAWTTSVNSREGVFASLSHTGERTPEGPELAWARRSDGPLQVLDPPPTRGEGWTAWRARLTRADGRPLAEVIEHRRQQGHQLWRVGLLVQVDHGGAVGRRAPTFQAILDSASDQAGDAFVSARDAHQAGGGPRADLAWAEQLHGAGRLAEADALYAALGVGTRVAGDATKARFALWRDHPEIVPADAIGQVTAALAGQSGDWRLMATGIRWLVAHEGCDPAREALAAVGQVWGDAQAWVRLVDEVGEGCPEG